MDCRIKPGNDADVSAILKVLARTRVEIGEAGPPVVRLRRDEIEVEQAERAFAFEADRNRGEARQHLGRPAAIDRVLRLLLVAIAAAPVVPGDAIDTEIADMGDAVIRAAL